MRNEIKYIKRSRSLYHGLVALWKHCKNTHTKHTKNHTSLQS